MGRRWLRKSENASSILVSSTIHCLYSGVPEMVYGLVSDTSEHCSLRVRVPPPLPTGRTSASYINKEDEGGAHSSLWFRVATNKACEDDAVLALKLPVLLIGSTH